MYNSRVSFNERLEEIVGEINSELGLVGDDALKLYFYVSDFLEFPAISVHYIVDSEPHEKTAELRSMIQLSLYVRQEDVLTMTQIMKKIYQKYGFISDNITGYVLLHLKDYESDIDNPICIGTMRLALDSGWKNMVNMDKEIRHYKLDLYLYHNFN